MAGFHLPRDTYFPNEGNAGWLEAKREEMIEEDPEEDPEEMDEEEESEEEEEEEEPKEEVINPPYIARVLANRFGHNGPKPYWATMIERWSRQQRQRSPYGDQHVYYDLSHGGPADRALLVMV
ncbi:protein FANTASTIC FOUR 1-like [Lactuca sativa]|uniref:protein FANTASTIC FOUR 1-like n=1 Tax=Lactuca sativa TaxID=4236 RepID=UPI000CD8C2CC|nr:protein FANTASTIC FOUR 1-like [Lactuca sativa]